MSNCHSQSSAFLRESDSHHSESDNDPLKSIFSGRFGNMQFNKSPIEIRCDTVGHDARESEAHNSVAPMLPSANPYEIYSNSKLGTNNAHLQQLQSKFLKIKSNSNNLLSSRFFTRKKYVLLFFLFLFMGSFLYGTMFSESSRWIPDVLKLKADLLSNLSSFIIYLKHGLCVKQRTALRKKLRLLVYEAVEDKIDDIVKKVQAAHIKNQSNFVKVYMEYQNKENGGFCITKRECFNFCNITEEKNKFIRITKAAKKDTEIKYTTVQATMSCCDRKSDLSEYVESFEKLFLTTMEKLQLILTSATEDIAERLEPQTLKNKATPTTHHCSAEAQKMVEYIIKYEEKGESTADKLVTFSREHIKCILHELFKEMKLVYDAEKAKSVDFALESAGGKILSIKQTENYFENQGSLEFLEYLKLKRQHSPEAAIQPGMEPGQCWAFKGSEGIIVIQLAKTISPTGFTVEHIPVSQSSSGDIDCAPKDFSVLGLLSRSDEEGKAFGLYSYNLKGNPLQYFPVQNGFNQSFNFVELRILSNHGNSEYTCLYRFRVHGKIQ